MHVFKRLIVPPSWGQKSQTWRVRSSSGHSSPQGRGDVPGQNWRGGPSNSHLDSKIHYISQLLTSFYLLNWLLWNKFTLLFHLLGPNLLYIPGAWEGAGAGSLAEDASKDTHVVGSSRCCNGNYRYDEEPVRTNVRDVGNGWQQAW